MNYEVMVREGRVISLNKYIVSIVVPVYNVMDLLPECLKTIIGQTYSNIEIILVDDGSTDKSGVICDTYAKQDTRIKVLHKKNGGLSSARNSGIQVATGTYIAFIDSDDYISKTMIEKMLNLAVKHEASIVCCDYTSGNFADDENVDIEVLNNSTAISRLLDEDGFKCYAWNKLYKRELFSDIYYPEGKLFEDITTTYKVFKKVDKIVYLKEALYYYRQREGSITKTKFSNRNSDLIEAINFVLEDSKKSGYSSDRLMVGYMGYYLFHIQKAFAASAEIAVEYNALIRNTRQNYLSLFVQNNISVKKRLQLIVIGLFPNMYKLMYLSLKRIKRCRCYG